MKKIFFLLLLAYSYIVCAQRVNGIEVYKKNAITYYLNENKDWMRKYKLTEQDVYFISDSLFVGYNFDSLIFSEVGVLRVSHKPKLIIAGNRYTGELIFSNNCLSYNSFIKRYISDRSNLEKAIFYMLIHYGKPIIDNFYQLPEEQLKKIEQLIGVTTSSTAFSACLFHCKMKRSERKKMLLHDINSSSIYVFKEKDSKIQRYLFQFKDGYIISCTIDELPM